MWSDKTACVAYAFPSYESGPKNDTPPAEQPHITKVAQEALIANQTISDRRPGERERSHPCSLHAHRRSHRLGHDPCRRAGHPRYRALRIYSRCSRYRTLAVGAWQIVVLRRWSHALGSIAADVAKSVPDSGQAIKPTSYPDLDRIVDAFNIFNARIKVSLERSVGLERDLRQA